MKSVTTVSTMIVMAQPMRETLVVHPSLLGVGIACVSDLDCGSEATCLGEDYGFPNGYCTVGCDGSCPDDGVCGTNLAGTASVL